MDFLPQFKLGDSIEGLMNAVRYLERTQQQQEI